MHEEFQVTKNHERDAAVIECRQWRVSASACSEEMEHCREGHLKDCSTEKQRKHDFVRGLKLLVLEQIEPKDKEPYCSTKI